MLFFINLLIEKSVILDKIFFFWLWVYLHIIEISKYDL